MTATVRGFERLRSMKYAAHLAIAALSLGLCACTTPTFVSPVEVTRFTGSQPNALATGTISVTGAPGASGNGQDDAAFQSAVAAELGRLGYSVTPSGGNQVAEVVVERFVSQPGGSNSPVSVGVGASSGSRARGTNVGMGVGLDLSPRPADQVATRLRVAIRPASGGDALWEGRAQFTASTNSQYADQHAAAAKMAAALFADFPGRSGETIEVR